MGSDPLGGTDPNRRDRPEVDRAHAGAHPAAASAGAAGLWFGGASSWQPDDAMSACLARNWWAIGLRGIFGVLFGILALLLPGITLASLVLIFAFYMLIDGVLDIIAGIRAARRNERWGALVFEGIVDLIAGAIAFVWPLVTVLAFVIVMGAWAIVSGGALTVAALRLHHTHGRWLMVFAGLVSVIWGVLLLIWPFAGAVVLTWWLGAYALIFGISLLVLAFRLRSRRVLPPQAGAVAQPG